MVVVSVSGLPGVGSVEIAADNQKVIVWDSPDGRLYLAGGSIGLKLGPEGQLWLVVYAKPGFFEDGESVLSKLPNSAEVHSAETMNRGGICPRPGFVELFVPPGMKVKVCVDGKLQSIEQASTAWDLRKATRSQRDQMLPATRTLVAPVLPEQPAQPAVDSADEQQLSDLPDDEIVLAGPGEVLGFAAVPAGNESRLRGLRRILRRP